MKNNAAMEDHWTNNPRFAKAEKQEQGEPVGEMTPRRAEMFMTRFKHEEKMLGPNEQAALDYVIAMLVAKQEQGEPVAIIHRNEYNEYRLEPHDSFDIKNIPLNVDLPLFKEQQRKPLTDRQINAIWDSLIASPDYSREMIVRAIEAAHGIKGDT